MSIQKKDSFAFAEESVEQDSEVFMGSLGVDSFFTNMSPEESIDIDAKYIFWKYWKRRKLNRT